MPSRKPLIQSFLLLFVIGYLTQIACSQHRQLPKQQVELQPKLMALPPTPASGPPDLRPPQPVEAQEAVSRVYGQSVIVESSRLQYFIAGDLNGDGSPDLAVVVRPAPGQMGELNHELANWIRCDPQKVKPPVPQKHGRILLQMVDPTVIEPHDVLMAVIHGYGPQGWRNPQARQSYLLKNAVGAGFDVIPATDALKLKKKLGRLPELRGDVVSQTLANERGLLYYTGAKYAWHRIGAVGP
jgi:hypothetical protein